MKALIWIMDNAVKALVWIFGCRHTNLTFPIKLQGPEKPATRVCLDCGKEFWYRLEGLN